LIKRLTRDLPEAIAIATLGLVATASPVFSAEEIIITYGFFERTIAIEDLQAFARGEGLSPQLAQYADSLSLSDSQLQAVQQLLTQRADLSVVDVAQFLYTAQGETLLNFLGQVVQTPTRQSGFLAIRSGLILAAADPDEGLTLLNFLESYPTPAIRVDVGKGLVIAGAIAETLQESERAIALVQSLAATMAEQPGDDLLSIRQLMVDPPLFRVKQEPLFIPTRGIDATLYWPQPLVPGQSLPNEIPVIVISHGLGDERASYDYLADYLAQRGFVVATLDHPGSNSRQIADLLVGLSPNVIDNKEFLNRPRDVSALLDRIERLAAEDLQFRDRLNIQNVGLIGQSFGGYTALALAGATFDQAALAAACEPRPVYLNPSLLLQCQAVAIATTPTDLADERIQAILVVNPIGSGIFGPSGFAQLDLPAMMVAATADTIAPALPEQIEPSTWLTTPERYLVLFSGSTHFSVIAANPNSASSIPVPSTLLGDSPELAQDYLQELSFAFFQRYLQGDTRYDAALTARYVNEFMARSPLEPLSLLQDLAPEQLNQALTAER
jgi:predicted dienelactone hydrolase